MFKSFAPQSLVQAASFFWGFACFLPVGMSYLAALLLLVSLLLTFFYSRDEIGARWHMLREHPVWWPLCFFIAWTVFILCVQPHYAETPSNFFHGLRIAMTIAIVLLLRKPELVAALFGLVVGAVVALGVIYLHRVIQLPMVPGLRNLLNMSQGNKSICIAILLTIFASCSFLYTLKHRANARAIVWLVPLVLVVPVLIWFLPSRTSLLLVTISFGLGLIHRLWRRPLWLVSSIFLLSMSGLGVSQITEFRNLFSRGATELLSSANTSHDANTTPSEASWSLRYMLYTQTINMVTEKPLLGWGIGAWNDQWRARTHPKIHYVNMPHNDFLWAGSQAGVVGMLSLVAVVFSLFIGVVRRRSYAATCSIVASSGMLIAMSFNSALRDAQIGMSLLFAVVVINAWARADG